MTVDEGTRQRHALWHRWRHRMQSAVYRVSERWAKESNLTVYLDAVWNCEHLRFVTVCAEGDEERRVLLASEARVLDFGEPTASLTVCTDCGAYREGAGSWCTPVRVTVLVDEMMDRRIR